MLLKRCKADLILLPASAVLNEKQQWRTMAVICCTGFRVVSVERLFELHEPYTHVETSGDVQ